MENNKKKKEIYKSPVINGKRKDDKKNNMFPFIFIYDKMKKNKKNCNLFPFSPFKVCFKWLETYKNAGRAAKRGSSPSP